MFSEAEKEAMAHALEGKSETVISVEIGGISGIVGVRTRHGSLFPALPSLRAGVHQPLLW